MNLGKMIHAMDSLSTSQKMMIELVEQAGFEGKGELDSKTLIMFIMSISASAEDSKKEIKDLKIQIGKLALICDVFAKEIIDD